MFVVSILSFKNLQEYGLKEGPERKKINFKQSSITGVLRYFSYRIIINVTFSWGQDEGFSLVRVRKEKNRKSYKRRYRVFMYITVKRKILTNIKGRFNIYVSRNFRFIEEFQIFCFSSGKGTCWTYKIKVKVRVFVWTSSESHTRWCGPESTKKTTNRGVKFDDKELKKKSRSIIIDTEGRHPLCLNQRM